MANRENNPTDSSGKHEHKLPQEIDPTDKRMTDAAHKAADKDIEADPEFSAHSPNDDLDEGETARLGEDKDLV